MWAMRSSLGTKCGHRACNKPARPEWMAGGLAFCSRSCRNIWWIEAKCRVPEGKDAGKPVQLREWQRFEVRKVYDNPAGTRRAIISFGRKNAKTTLAAFLLLLHTCGPEALPNSQ